MNTRYTNHGAFIGPTKQPEDPFQLPPPPPGMRWHREDGWQADDLPQGYRPFLQGETLQKGDEWKQHSDNKWQVVDSADTGIGWAPNTSHPFRTTRPLTFTHAGKQWTYHRPGDPMPCEPEKQVQWLLESEAGGQRDYRNFHSPAAHLGRYWHDIIGWRYAEPQTKEVELGPEDVPPGSVFRPIGWSGMSNTHVNYEAVVTNGVRTIGREWGDFCSEYGYLPWSELKNDWQINRSLPLTGKWNPDAWEPCKKTLPA